MDEQREQLAYDIKDKLSDAWRLLFRNIPPAPETMLGCGLVLAEMRIKAEETKNPFFPHSEIAELVDKAIAHPECKSLDRQRFSDNLVRICTLCRAATVGYMGFILEDDFFIRYLAMGTYNAR
ncbi:hypothetical protein NUN60_005100 [Escherichia coli]|nr:hypothetical protein [Escherichia coli]EJO8768089.1 hypothetical protein [Escherichia coli]